MSTLNTTGLIKRVTPQVGDEYISVYDFSDINYRYNIFSHAKTGESLNSTLHFEDVPGFAEDGYTPVVLTRSFAGNYVGGNFKQFRDFTGTLHNVNRLMRLDTFDGSVDTSFVPTFSLEATSENFEVTGIAEDSDGAVYVTYKDFSRPGGPQSAIVYTHKIIKLDNAGDIVAGPVTFSVNQGSSTYRVQMLARGEDNETVIYLANSNITAYNGTSRSGIVKIRDDLTLDTNFVVNMAGSFGSPFVASMCLSDGLLIMGNFNSVLDPDGIQHVSRNVAKVNYSTGRAITTFASPLPIGINPIFMSEIYFDDHFPIGFSNIQVDDDENTWGPMVWLDAETGAVDATKFIDPNLYTYDPFGVGESSFAYGQDLSTMIVAITRDLNTSNGANFHRIRVSEGALVNLSDTGLPSGYDPYTWSDVVITDLSNFSGRFTVLDVAGNVAIASQGITTVDSLPPESLPFSQTLRYYNETGSEKELLGVRLEFLEFNFEPGQEGGSFFELQVFGNQTALFDSETLPTLNFTYDYENFGAVIGYVPLVQPDSGLFPLNEPPIRINIQGQPKTDFRVYVKWREFVCSEISPPVSVDLVINDYGDGPIAEPDTNFPSIYFYWNDITDLGGGNYNVEVQRICDSQVFQVPGVVVQDNT